MGKCTPPVLEKRPVLLRRGGSPATGDSPGPRGREGFRRPAPSADVWRADPRGLASPASPGCTGRSVRAGLRAALREKSRDCTTLCSGCRSGGAPYGVVLLGDGVAGPLERLVDQTVGVEVDLPVVDVAAIRPHREHRACQVELEDVDF